MSTAADHGAFDAAADPSKYPAGMFGIVTGSYTFPVAHAEVDAYFTNKAPGGIAYRCSFRVTEASYAIERGHGHPRRRARHGPGGAAPKELRQERAVPLSRRRSGFTYDSGDYHQPRVALEKIGYQALLKEQAEKRARGELMGIGISTFTEVVGAGPSKHFDILGIKMFDSAEIRIHPTGAGIVRAAPSRRVRATRPHGRRSWPRSWVSIRRTIMVEEGDTDTAPYGLGTYASRSTRWPARRSRWRRGASATRRGRSPPTCSRSARATSSGRTTSSRSRGCRAKTVTMKEVAFAAYTNPGPNEPGLEATNYYDPPNMTFPFGAYIAVVDVDRDTGEVKVRRFLAVDDCGTIINPMVVEGPDPRRPTEGFAIAFMQEIQDDAEGNNLNTNFTDYLLPTSLETPKWETANTVTPSPHHPIGAKGVGESPNVGSPAAFVNAVVDALSPLGIRHIDMPITRDKVWRAIRDAQARRADREAADSGQERIAAGVEPVWAFVNDPDRVGHCLPDVVDVTVQDPTHFDAVVAGRRRSCARTGSNSSSSSCLTRLGGEWT